MYLPQELYDLQSDPQEWDNLRYELASHIPIILFTARGSEAAPLEGLRTGANDYIVRPFRADLLVAPSIHLSKNGRP